MRAILVEHTGGADALRLVDVSTARPGPGEVLVRVEAAGVNFIDVYQRSGAYTREVPFVPGSEGAGVVEVVGEGANELEVGNRVAWSSVDGSYATHARARADRLVRIPDEVSSRDAAAVMLQGMTAHYLVHTTFPLGAGQTCVVHAAAGGVGLLLVQMAKRAGARVVATASTEEKRSLARAAGADVATGYDGFEKVAEGADVVYDSVGAATFERSLLCLRPRGMLVLFGQSSGRVPPFDLQVLSARGSLFVTRPTLRDYVATRAELVDRATAVLSAVAGGDLRVRVHAEYPLERAADAHRDLESRATTGKLLLVPA